MYCKCHYISWVYAEVKSNGLFMARAIMKANWFMVVAWVWWSVAVGPTQLACSSGVTEDQHKLRYEKVKFKITHSTTGNDYTKFMNDLRNNLFSGRLSNEIPLLRDDTSTPISNPERFVLVELTNEGEDTITVAVDVVNVYVVGYQAGDQSYFFRGQNPDPSPYLFTDTTQNTLPFTGSYDDLEREAGANRDQLPLGTEELIQAVTGLRYSNIQQTRARSLIVVIQMICEAARFRDIEWRVRKAIQSGESSPPDTYMLSLETSWGQQSTRVQESTEGVFNSPLNLQYSTGNFITLSNVRDVIANLALMLFVCGSRSSSHELPMIIRPVVMERNYVGDDVCPVSEPTVRIVGRDGQCVDVRDGKFNDGNPIQLWPCKSNTDANQLWTLKRDGTIRSNGKCMTAYGFKAGQYVMIYDCNSAVTSATKWEIWNNGTIISPQSSVVLGADSGSSGTTLTVQTNIYSTGQGWLAGNDTKPREVTIIGFEDLCMQANGAAVWLETCADTVIQRWALYADGSIRPQQNQVQCLTCERDSSSTVITIISCSTGSSGQRWAFTNEGTILNLNNGLVMDVKGSDPSLHQIIIYPSTGNPNQKWLTVP